MPKLYAVQAIHQGVADDPVLFRDRGEAERYYAELGVSLNIPWDADRGCFDDDDDEEVHIWGPLDPSAPVEEVIVDEMRMVAKEKWIQVGVILGCLRALRDDA